MRTAGLGVIAAIGALVALLSLQPAGSGAQVRPTNAPFGQANPCTGVTFLAAAIQCPPPVATQAPTNPPRQTPVPAPTQPPLATPRPTPIVVPCGGTLFVPIGQACPTPTQPAFIGPVITQTPPVTPIPTPVPFPTNPQPQPVNQLPASISISGQNPVIVTIRANQPLNILHSVVIDVGPNTQATGVQVSAGTATIVGSQVIWNGFSLDTGQEASATVSLAATGGMALTGNGPPVIQSISMEALDLAGNPVILQSDSSGIVVSTTAPSCTTGGGQSLIACVGASEYTTPQFVVAENWVLSWVFGPCQNGSGAFTLTILNTDGSVSQDNAGYSETSAGNFGTQQYQTGGSYSVQILSVCPWNVQVQVP
jgi:hypothetical protein